MNVLTNVSGQFMYVGLRMAVLFTQLIRSKQCSREQHYFGYTIKSRFKYKYNTWMQHILLFICAEGRRETQPRNNNLEPLHPPSTTGTMIWNNLDHLYSQAWLGQLQMYAMHILFLPLKQYREMQHIILGPNLFHGSLLHDYIFTQDFFRSMQTPNCLSPPPHQENLCPYWRNGQ